MTPTPDVSAAPSPAPEVSIPTEGKAYAEWRQTGKLPEPKADPAPAKTSSDEGPQASGKAPDSEPGTKQEPQAKRGAESRLQELLADLKTAGLSPAELKTFKREAQRQEAATTKAAPQTEQPKQQSGPVEPVEPKLSDFSGDNAWEQFETANRKFNRDLAKYEAAQAVESYKAQQREETQQRELSTQVDAAKGRYGDEAGATIGSAIDALVAAEMPGMVKSIINDSPVLIDLAYVMGSQPAELAEFLSLAKSNPLAAIRKVVLMEELVKQELTKAAPATSASAERGEDGKFVSQKAPERKTTAAPPPPTEVSGRSSAPPDAIEGAAKSGDFTAYREAANARDLAKRRGR